MCGSKNYPYLPHGRDFSFRSHHLSRNSSQASYIYLTFWAFENPPPPGISSPFCGGSMDVFWIYKIHNYIEILSNLQIQLCLSGTGPQSQRPVVKLRWLDIVFQGQYLPSLNVNCVAINKDLEKLTPQLY